MMDSRAGGRGARSKPALNRVSKKSGRRRRNREEGEEGFVVIEFRKSRKSKSPRRFICNRESRRTGQRLSETQAHGAVYANSLGAQKATAAAVYTAVYYSETDGNSLGERE